MSARNVYLRYPRRRAVLCTVIVLATVLSALATGAKAEPLRLYAAGSLKAAMTDIAREFETAGGGHDVEVVFAPSGLLRQRIEAGETAHVFASANMKHPRSLEAAGMGAGPVRMFATNALCAIAQPDVDVTTETLLDRLLDDGVRVGTSTPKADPAGDYAFALFAKAETLRPGARTTLESKALKLTGGPDTQKAPEGRNLYGWVMAESGADIFLTYCTNAVLAKKDTESLQIVAIPKDLAVGAKYGLIVLKGAPPKADTLAEFILGARAQRILGTCGFGKGSDTE